MREPEQSGLVVQVKQAAEGITALAAVACDAADRDAADRDSGDRDSEAQAVLVYAAAGFAIAGTVSQLLDTYGLPRLEVFGWAGQRCGQMMKFLQEVLGPETLSRYAPFDWAALQRLQNVGAAELCDRGTPETTEMIAAAVVTLAAAVRDATGPVAEDPGITAQLRGAARMAADAAELLHAQFGGDGGGLL